MALSELFYDGMSSSMKQILETMCGGDFMSKNPKEAMDFLSYVAEVSRGWDEPNSREKEKFPSQQNQNPKAGMYMLSEDVDIKAKVATLARRLEELELKKIHEVQAISDTQVHVMPCTICQSCDHIWPNNSASYGNTYNSSWRNHPNFSWKPRPPSYQPQGQTQVPQQPSSVEQAIVNLSKVMGEQKAINSQLHQKIENVESSQIKRMEGMQNDLSQKIDDIQYSISRLTNLNTVIEKGKFPSQPSQNPRVFMKLKPKMEDMMKKHMPPPFPQALHGKKEIKNSSEILEVLRQVKVTKNAFLTEQVSAIIQRRELCANILGRPFLATSNAIINFRNGVMQLTFGNMTLELNIFHLCKRHLHPEEEEGFEEVCLINTLVEEHCDKNLEESLNESLEVLEEGLPEPFDVLAIMSPWRRREEILPLFNQEDSQGATVEDPPKLALKPLPVDLNANFIWDPGS
ncbi:hypothetical protein CK203_115121 [Vitis vinifera]|uniref:Uncharacterized protein n=1 Tax=Vitis vinifera TaxID=29760 RepID=A0A438C3U3_VITVI|nr:hypothetical protein CK203_115121 [Vitis vinifera]